MNYILAKNDKQLGMCLRMLFDDGLTEVVVHPIMNKQHKVEFRVILDNVEEDRFERLRECYEMLIL